MKRTLFFSLLLFPALIFGQPCTTSNGSGCDCPDGSAVCDLRPDITISWYGLEQHDNGPNEYPQTGAGLENGRLRLTGSTPNIGWGPFTVRGVDANGNRKFICGSDTFSIHDPNSTTEFTCPNGHPEPKQVIFQRVYHKDNGTMTFTDHESGTMTYHPNHGHNHVDDWAIFTLRVQNPNEPDTLKWPIIGTGAKIGFCLMDYGSCDDYAGHCRNFQNVYGAGTVLTSSSFPNYGLGGGQYNCSPIEQGISVGYTDIYSETLDGMWINIPPNTCNGNYWIVAEVDPNNNFIEMNENNNWTAIPFTLTRQLPAGSAVAEITLDKSPFVCNNSTVTLQANTATSYLWSTGATTSSIAVTTPGDYYVRTNSLCGQAVSDTVTIASINSAITTLAEDTVCVAGAATLTAQGTGQVNWFDAISGGNFLVAGNTFTTPALQNTTTFYAENTSIVPGVTAFSRPVDFTGNSAYSSTNFNSYLIFDCFKAFTLKSVKVYTDFPGTRTIEWRTSDGTVLADTTLNIPAGTTRINLNFNIVPGTDYQLGTNQALNNTNFGYNSPALKRTSSGVNYPYDVPGVLSVHGSDNGPSYYYYFYHWEIEHGSAACASPRTAVQAVVSAPVLSISGLDTVYQASATAVNLTGQPAGGTFSGTGVSGNTFNPQIAGLGIHTVTYSYTDSMGCAGSTTADVRVRIGQITASAGAVDAEICVGANTTLTASGGTVFTWSTGEQTDAITVNPLTTTTYTVTVSDGFGATDVADVTVTVNSLPTVDITGLAAEYFVNENPVTLSGSPNGGTFAGDGVSGAQFAPTQAGVGLHLITYNYTDSHGCAAADSQQVNVKQTTVTASAGADAEICLNDQTTLTATGGTQYAWSTGDQTATITVSPEQTTTYTVTVSDSFGSSDDADVTVTVLDLPVVDFSGLAAEYFDKDAAATLTGSPAGGTFSGQGITGDSFSPAAAGIGGPYTVTYIYTDANGCVNTATHSAEVKEFVGINPVLSRNIRVYPNPAQNWLIVDFSDLKGESITVKMLNAVGKEIITLPLMLTSNNVQSTLDLTSIPAGIYFLEVVTQQGTHIRKVVRE